MDVRGLSLLLVIRGGLWLGECLDMTGVGPNSLLRLTLEPSSRMAEIIEHGSHTRRSSLVSGRYVACIVSFFGSQSSPFFHRRKVTAAILRASVTLARSSLTPRPSEAS